MGSALGERLGLMKTIAQRLSFIRSVAPVEESLEGFPQFHCVEHQPKADARSLRSLPDANCSARGTPQRFYRGWSGVQMLRNEAKAASCFHNPVAQIKRHFGGEKGIPFSPPKEGGREADCRRTGCVRA